MYIFRFSRGGPTISLIHVHIHPCGHTHACVHGWRRVFLCEWIGACIFACMNDYMYISLRVRLHTHTGSEWEIFCKCANA